MPTSVKKKDGGKIAGPASVPGVVEVAIVFQLPNTKRSIIKFHGSYTTPPSNMQTLATNLLTSLQSSWSSNLAPLCYPQTFFQQVQVRDMSSFTNPISVATATTTPGTSASPAMPPGASIVLTENVAIRGKGVKGRMYLPGWATNADAGAGQITTAAQTAVNAFGTSIASALSAQSLSPCVAQVARQQYAGITGTVHPARPAGHIAVTSYVCQDLLWDQQRRRAQL